MADADTRTRAYEVATAAEAEWRFGVNNDRRNLREAIVDALCAAGLLRAPHDDAAIERAARALYVRDGRGTDRDYDALNDAGIHARYWNDAAALLAASEEGTDA